MINETHVTTPINSNVTAACTDARELSVNDLELISGGNVIGDTLHRIGFALGCILGGDTLTIKSGQLQCKI